jgi:hypothetical protein
MTHLITPINNLEDPRSTLGQNPSSNPFYSLNPLMPFWNFGAFSKISLNTSKPPKEKNVQNVEAHNFAVEWHLKFGGILGETGLGRCSTPVH